MGFGRVWGVFCGGGFGWFWDPLGFNIADGSREVSWRPFSPLTQAVDRKVSRSPVGTSAGRRADLRLSRRESGRNPARRPDFELGPYWPVLGPY
jgi:hypothetical protein